MMTLFAMSKETLDGDTNYYDLPPMTEFPDIMTENNVEDVSNGQNARSVAATKLGASLTGLFTAAAASSTNTHGVSFHFTSLHRRPIALR